MPTVPVVHKGVTIPDSFYQLISQRDQTYAARSVYLYDAIHDETMTMWPFTYTSKPSWWEQSLLSSSSIARLNNEKNLYFDRSGKSDNTRLNNIFIEPKNIFQTDAFTFNAGENVATLIGFSGLIDQAGVSCVKWLQYNAKHRLKDLPQSSNNGKGPVIQILEKGGLCMYSVNSSNDQLDGVLPQPPDTMAYTAYIECDLLLFWYYAHQTYLEAVAPGNAADDRILNILRTVLGTVLGTANDKFLQESVNIDYLTFLNRYRSLCLSSNTTENMNRIKFINLYVLNNLWQLSCLYLEQTILDPEGEIIENGGEDGGEVGITATAAKETLSRLYFTDIVYKKNGQEPLLTCGFYNIDGHGNVEHAITGFDYATSQAFVAYYGLDYQNKVNSQLGSQLGHIVVRGTGSQEEINTNIQNEISAGNSTKATMMANIATYVETYVGGNPAVNANAVNALIASFLKLNGDSFHLLTWQAVNTALGSAGYYNYNNQYILCKEGPFTERILIAGANAILDTKLSILHKKQATNGIDDEVLIGGVPSGGKGLLVVGNNDQFLIDEYNAFLNSSNLQSLIQLVTPEEPVQTSQYISDLFNVRAYDGDAWRNNKYALIKCSISADLLISINVEERWVNVIQDIRRNMRRFIPSNRGTPTSHLTSLYDMELFNQSSPSKFMIFFNDLVLLYESIKSWDKLQEIYGHQGVQNELAERIKKYILDTISENAEKFTVFIGRNGDGEEMTINSFIQMFIENSDNGAAINQNIDHLRGAAQSLGPGEKTKELQKINNFYKFLMNMVKLHQFNTVNNSEEGGGVNMPGGSNHNNKTMRGGGGYNNNKTMRGGNKDLPKLINMFLEKIMENPNTRIDFENVLTFFKDYDNGHTALIIYLQLTLSGLTHLAKHWLSNNQGYYIYPYVVTSIYLAIHGHIPPNDYDLNTWKAHYIAAMELLNSNNNNDEISIEDYDNFKKILIDVFNIPCPPQKIALEEEKAAAPGDWAEEEYGEDKIYVNVESGAAYEGSGELKGKWQFANVFPDDLEALGGVNWDALVEGAAYVPNNGLEKVGDRDLWRNPETRAVYNNDGTLVGFMNSNNLEDGMTECIRLHEGVKVREEEWGGKQVLLTEDGSAYHPESRIMIGHFYQKPGELVPTDCPDYISFFIIQSVYKNIFAYIPHSNDDESIFSNKYDLILVENDQENPIIKLNKVYNTYINIIDNEQFSGMYDGELEDSFYLFINQMSANDLVQLIPDLENTDFIKELFITLDDLGLSSNRLFELLYHFNQDVNVIINHFVPIFHVIKNRRLAETPVAGNTRSASLLTNEGKDSLPAYCLPFLDEDINELQSIIINNFRVRTDNIINEFKKKLGDLKFIFHRFGAEVQFINLVQPNGEDFIFFINIDYIFFHKSILTICVQANGKGKTWIYEADNMSTLDTFFNNIHDHINNPDIFTEWVNGHGISTGEQFESFQMRILNPHKGGSKTKKMKKGKKTKRNKKKHKKVKKTQKRFKKHKGIKRKNTQKRKISKKIKKTQKRRRRNKNNKTT
tara:strand:- start:15251 stop:19834 length:4584 start_codon:yes stop_codon:yes gene_type:complete